MHKQSPLELLYTTHSQIWQIPVNRKKDTSTLILWGEKQMSFTLKQKMGILSPQSHPFLNQIRKSGNWLKLQDNLTKKKKSTVYKY